MISGFLAPKSLQTINQEVGAFGIGLSVLGLLFGQVDDFSTSGSDFIDSINLFCPFIHFGLAFSVGVVAGITVPFFLSIMILLLLVFGIGYIDTI